MNVVHKQVTALVLTS